MPTFPSRELAEVAAKCRGGFPRDKLAELTERFFRQYTGARGVVAEILPVFCGLLPEKTSLVVAAAAAATPFAAFAALKVIVVILLCEDAANGLPRMMQFLTIQL